ncbi:hypothetical protein [Phytohabitans rumicis]|uniref:ERAP1-like C-terminal domain-containing protein n=1 Tax=Phytohabitans rumicis TaxID=1076125 RepID=A0A6V8LMM0_9ACTN|nr:hypothetical protein [Phytohabitans rumicis]GFJ96261.1 hypothetical protein Prum_099030 [Phytohabitans rumicis]
MFAQALRDLLAALGEQSPPPDWPGDLRAAARHALRGRPARDEWFAPLVRAAVYDPNPSYNRRLIEPALKAFGRRRVQAAVLDYLRTGTNAERAGAARAWYWTQAPLTYIGRSPTPTPESQAEYDAVAGLRQQWRDAALHLFVSTDDLGLRRQLLPGLDLRTAHYPAELRETVAQAIHIARTHPDEYLRHRVEQQI